MNEFTTNEAIGPHFEYAMIDVDDRKLIEAIEGGINENPHIYQKALSYYSDLLEASNSDQPARSTEAFISLFNTLNKNLVSNTDFMAAYDNILQYFKGRVDAECGFDSVTESSIERDEKMTALREAAKNSKLSKEDKEAARDKNRIARLEFFIGRVMLTRTLGGINDSVKDIA